MTELRSVVDAPLAPEADWTATHRALARAVGDAVGMPVDHAVPERVDWSRFAGLASRHSVLPLVRRSAWLAGQAVPPAIDSRLHVSARRCAAASLADLTALGTVLEAARRAGLDLLVLRGLPLAGWAYGDPLARQSNEVHLYVEPASVPATAELLGGLGFEPIWPGDGPGPGDRGGSRSLADAIGVAPELTFSGSRTFVDLHWGLFANPALLPLDLTDPRNRLCVDLSGLEVVTMAREPTWWYLATLGTLRRWSSLKWVADVPAMVSACPALVSPDALERAAEAGVDRCVATALRLAADLLGMPLDPSVATWVAGRAGSDRLVHQSRRYLAATMRPECGRVPARLVERASFELEVRADGRYRRATVQLALAEVVRGRMSGLARWARWPLLRRGAAGIANAARTVLARTVLARAISRSRARSGARAQPG